MNKAQPNPDAPWWEQFPERLEQESERFATAFSPPFALRCDPRTSDPNTSESESERFIWRGEVRARVRGIEPRFATGDRFVVDFIYPENYPFGRIEVEFIEPRIERARHLVGPNVPCYLSYDPNGWTPDTTNAQVYDLIKNWLIGYLSDWRFGNSIRVPEHALLLGGATSAFQVFLPEEIYQRNLWGLGQGVLTLQSRMRDSERVVFVQKLRDDYWQSEVSGNSLENQKTLLLGGEETWQRQAIWFDVKGAIGSLSNVADLLNLYEQQGPFPGQRPQRAHLESLLIEHSFRGCVLIFVRFEPIPGQIMWFGCALLAEQKKSGLPPLVNHRPLRQRKRRQIRRLRRGTLAALLLHPLRQRDLFRRLEGVYPAQEFHTKKVAIIGCGSVGATAAVSLAKAGINQFVFCDGDRFSVTNVVRHELDLRFVGRDKAQGLGEYIQSLNPFAQVQSVPQRLYLAKDISDAIREADVVVVAIADKAIEALISRVALREGKTVFYGRGHAQMSVARVARVVPGKDACPLCLSQHALEEGLGAQSDRYLWVEDSKHRLYDDGCGSAAVPGAGVDTQIIGNLLARRVIEFLEGQQGEKNHWVQIARAQPKATDWRLWNEGVLHAQKFEPLEDCAECGYYQEQRAAQNETVGSLANNAEEQLETPLFNRIKISAAAHRAIVEECAACGRLETGGVLIGYVDAQSQTLVVTHATDAGPEATHRARYFQRDRAHCQREVERICEQTQGASDYVGEWHRHVGADTRPSPTDEQTLVNVATRPNYALTQAAMIICGMPHASRAHKHTLRGLSFRRGEEGVRELPVIRAE